MDILKKEITGDEFHKNRHCFMLCVIAHGDEKMVSTWKYQELLDDLDEVNSLCGKPKLLVINSCRSSEVRTF